jgi:hypothetical protein
MQAQLAHQLAFVALYKALGGANPAETVPPEGTARAAR